jgi:hypothetical protein
MNCDPLRLKNRSSVSRQRPEYRGSRFRAVFGEEQFRKFRRLELALCAAKRLPDEFDVDFGLPRRYLVRNLTRNDRKFSFRRRPMHDHNAVTADTDIPAARVHQMDTVVILPPNVGYAQLLGVQEFDDPSFQRHAYNCSFE